MLYLLKKRLCRIKAWSSFLYLAGGLADNLRQPTVLFLIVHVNCNRDMNTVISLKTFEELRGHVLEILCAHDKLDPQQTPLHQGIITRSGRPCGLFFQAQGPRLLKTYAVWAGDENRILFYDSNGTRFGETRLFESPDPLLLAA